MHRVLTAGLVALLALSLVPSASAQSSLSGQVLDQDGAPVAGATVSVYQYGEASDAGEVEVCSEGNCSSGRSWGGGATVTTDADGRFSVPAQAGRAEISVWKEGYVSHHRSIDVDGQAVTVQLEKFPEKTARIQGTVRGSDGGLPAYISIDNPQHGVYECSVREGDEGRVEPAPAGTSGSDGAADSSGASKEMIAPSEPYLSGCAITVRADGSYEGLVTPGYSIIRFSSDSWSSGGPDHYSLTRVVDLPAGQTTRLDVQLTARPGPDARLGGHIVDATTQRAIPGVQVGFSSQDAYGWAQAQTDRDGSYQVRLRSGFTQISVWADGYLPWEGQVNVRAGADGQRFNIELTPGQARYGGCCAIYAEKDMAAPMDGQARGLGATSGSSTEDAASAPAFEDMGGGLGPYDPSAAGNGLADSNGASGFSILAVALGLLAVVLVSRRR